MAAHTKRAVLWIANGAVLIGGGMYIWATGDLPSWSAGAIQVIGLVFSILGGRFVWPNNSR